jgi:hypothetical protein
MLPLSLDCQLLIAPSVFSNVYEYTIAFKFSILLSEISELAVYLVIAFLCIPIQGEQRNLILFTTWLFILSNIYKQN